MLGYVPQEVFFIREKKALFLVLVAKALVRSTSLEREGSCVFLELGPGLSDG